MTLSNAELYKIWEASPPTRRLVLTRLLEEDGEWISGELLADRCGVSRQAINKNVFVLRRLGVLIEARSKKGYRYTEDI